MPGTPKLSRPTTLGLLLATCLAVAVPQAHADTAHAHRHGHHGAHQADVPMAPRENGQAAFAAMAEIVALLEADPATDWSRVDLDALWHHLMDMDEVMLRAQAETTPIPGGLRARVTGNGRTFAAIEAMVPAHAGELDRRPDWSARAEVGADAVLLEVTSDDPAQVQRIRGLGFFGLMASGEHHRPHHLAIARGEPMHRH